MTTDAPRQPATDADARVVAAVCRSLNMIGLAQGVEEAALSMEVAVGLVDGAFAWAYNKIERGQWTLTLHANPVERVRIEFQQEDGPADGLEGRASVTRQPREAIGYAPEGLLEEEERWYRHEEQGAAGAPAHPDVSETLLHRRIAEAHQPTHELRALVHRGRTAWDLKTLRKALGTTPTVSELDPRHSEPAALDVDAGERLDRDEQLAMLSAWAAEVVVQSGAAPGSEVARRRTIELHTMIDLERSGDHWTHKTVRQVLEGEGIAASDATVRKDFVATQAGGCRVLADGLEALSVCEKELRRQGLLESPRAQAAPEDGLDSTDGDMLTTLAMVRDLLSTWETEDRRLLGLLQEEGPLSGEVDDAVRTRALRAAVELWPRVHLTPWRSIRGCLEAGPLTEDDLEGLTLWSLLRRQHRDT